MYRARGRLLANHPLGQQVDKRFVNIHHPEVPHHLGEKTGVEQMHDSVFYSADILVNRQPVLCFTFINRPLIIIGASVAGKIPRALNESIKGIGLASRRGITARTDGFGERFNLRERTATLAGKGYIRRKNDRQI